MLLVGGSGLNPNIATVKGYIENEYIQFVKEYPVYYRFENDGSMAEYKLSDKPILMYNGEFNFNS